MNTMQRFSKRYGQRVRCAWLAAVLAGSACLPQMTLAVEAEAPEVKLPAVALTSDDLEFMLQAQRLCNGRIAAARLVLSRSTDHAVRKVALDLLRDYRNLAHELQRLAREKGVALPVDPSSEMTGILAGLAGLSHWDGGQMEAGFLRRVGVDAEAEALMLFHAKSQDANAWSSLRELAASMLPQVHRRIAVARAIGSARGAGG